MNGPRPMLGRVPWPTEASGEVPYERPAPRQTVTYTCDRGDRFEVVFSATADVPDAWVCRCGAGAGLADAEPRPAHRDEHWAKVLQRRTVAELEELLAERIAASRSGGPGTVGPAR